MLVYLSIHSFTQHLLSTCYVPVNPLHEEGRPLQRSEKSPEVEPGAPSRLIITPGICCAVSEGD